jgi:hypothetical protein
MNTDVIKQAKSGARTVPTVAGLPLPFVFVFYLCSSVFICVHLWLIGLRGRRDGSGRPAAGQADLTSLPRRAGGGGRARQFRLLFLSFAAARVILCA